jgi:ribose transport system ATP-binding protein
VGLLTISEISKSFPGVKAVDKVSLAFRPGEIHALMGENGAGKSTLMKIMTGIYQADSGTMVYDGKNYAPASYRESLAAGIDIVHQEIQVVPQASVAENIMLDKLSTFSRRGRIDWNQLNGAAGEYMEAVGLKVAPTQSVISLSAGQKQLLQIARALSARAAVILLDEPTSSLSGHESDNLFLLLANLKKSNTTLIYVSHKLDEVYQVSDVISVMRDGKLIGTRSAADLPRNELIRMMIGREAGEQRIGQTRANPNRVLLQTENLTKKNQCKRASFELREGEILGFYGLVGSGRTELARVLIGESRADSGTIRVNGEKAVIRRISDAFFRYRIGYVTENRKEEGLFLDETVLTNLSLLIWRKIRNPWTFYIPKKTEAETGAEMASALSVKMRNLRTPVATLSGGNQQKISIGRWLLNDCNVLIVDEPTVGVDVGAKEQIHRLIWELAAEKRKGIILISSDMAEIIRLSTRLHIFRNQEIIGEIKDLEEQSYETVRDRIGDLLNKQNDGRDELPLIRYASGDQSC